MCVSLASLQADYRVGIFGIPSEHSERRQKRHPERDEFYTLLYSCQLVFIQYFKIQSPVTLSIYPNRV